jgi:hypothetical protein
VDLGHDAASDPRPLPFAHGGLQCAVGLVELEVVVRAASILEEPLDLLLGLMWNSTRRFVARPSAVRLSSRGRSSPYPMASMRVGAMA